MELVCAVVPTEAPHPVPCTSATVTRAAVEATSLVRGRTYVRGRQLTRHVGTGHEGVVPTRLRPAGLRAETEAAFSSGTDVGAFPTIVRLVVLATGPVVAASVVASVVPAEVGIDVTQRTTRVIGPSAVEARLEMTPIPSQPVQLVLQVLLAAGLGAVRATTFATLRTAAATTLADVEAAVASA